MRTVSRPKRSASAVVVVATLAVVLAPLAASAASPAWLTASVAPGTVNAYNDAYPSSVACASAGNCTVFGSYSTAAGDEDFIYTEVNGKWGTPVEVAGALDAGHSADAGAVSCGLPGDCALGGTYDHNGRYPFVASEVNGKWGPATETAAALNSGGDGMVDAVSCVGPDDCAAEGLYSLSAGGTAVFVVSDTSGKWGTATRVATSLNTHHDVEPEGVSCTAPGDCTAIGNYSLTAGHDEAGMFGDTETGGVWAPAVAIGATYSAHGSPTLSGLSCAAPGDCVAVGTNASGGLMTPFALTETGGKWSAPAVLDVSLDSTSHAVADAVSCAAPGDCTAGGRTVNGSDTAAWVQTETGGHWASAHAITLYTGTLTSTVVALSCWAPGDCAATGSYASAGPRNSWVATSANGVWTSGAVLNGANSTSGSYGGGVSVSCIGAGFCSVTGIQQTSAGYLTYASSHQGDMKLGLTKPASALIGKKVTITVTGVTPGATVTLRRTLLHVTEVTAAVATRRSVAFSVSFPVLGKWTVTATARAALCLSVPATGTVKVT